MAYDIPGNIGWMTYLAMGGGAALCAMFAGLLFRGYKIKRK